jgi:hypothetical protein
VELVDDTLFGGLTKDGGGWLWHSDKIDNRTEVVLGYCLGGFVERAKGSMGNIVGEVVPTAITFDRNWEAFLSHTGRMTENPLLY